MGLFDKLKNALKKTREADQEAEVTPQEVEAASAPEEIDDSESESLTAPQVQPPTETPEEAFLSGVEQEVWPDLQPIVEIPEKTEEKPEKKKKNGVFGLGNIFKHFRKVDEELMEELEESLIFADVGMETTMEMTDELRDKVKEDKIKDIEGTKEALKEIMVEHLKKGKILPDQYPMVILMVGVNGVGKTTTIGKIANLYRQKGKSVTIAAADTFRAAAVEQLQEWGKRSGAHVIKHGEGGDPAAVVFDAIDSVKAKGTDVLIVDTAGRLHNKKNLMDELNKIKRTIDKNYGNAHLQTYLALDATTGQNGVNQAEVFTQAASVDAVCLSKLDGTAKGGVVFGICDRIGIGVKYVGVGEGIDDIVEFDPKEFVDAIIGD